MLPVAARITARYRGRGERHGRAVLRECDVREIRRMLAAGTTQADVARHFGVSYGAVSMIKTRRTWGWLAQ